MMIICEKCRGNGKRLGIGQILIDCKVCKGKGEIEKIGAAAESITHVHVDLTKVADEVTKNKIPADFDVNEIIEKASAKYSKSQAKRIAEQKKQRGRKRKTAESSVFFA